MTYRVIQWATGTIGQASIRAVLASPAYELVGVFVATPEKAGQDAGTIAGVGPCGVAATADRAALLALEADATIYAPRAFFDSAEHDQDVLEMLRAGKNVITPVGYWYPPLYGQEYVDELAAACKEGDASLLGTGENPGLMLCRLATTLATSVSELKSVELREMVDVSSLTPTLLFDVVGFGKHPDELAAGSVIAMMMDRYFNEEIYLTAHQLGIELDGVERSSRLATLEQAITIEAGEIPAGGVVAMEYRWSGMSGGIEVISIQNTWYAYDDVPGWELSEHWKITLDARPPLVVDIRGTSSDYVTAMEITATHCVNSISRVCDAESGILYPEAPALPPHLWARPVTTG